MSQISKSYAGILKAARESRRLSQADVASRMGITQTHVSKIERGADIRVSTLVNLARTLDMELVLVPKEYATVIAALASGDDQALDRPRYALDNEDGDDQDI